MIGHVRCNYQHLFVKVTQSVSNKNLCFKVLQMEESVGSTTQSSECSAVQSLDFAW